MGAIDPARDRRSRRIRSNPFPSGPSTWIASPAASADSARVPAPHRIDQEGELPGRRLTELISRGSTSPRPQHEELTRFSEARGRRSRRSNVGPAIAPCPRRSSARSSTASTRLPGTSLMPPPRCAPATAARNPPGRWRSRAPPPPGAGDRRDARDAGGERSLADQVAVARAALQGVDDEVAAPAPYEVDDGGLVAARVTNLRDDVELEAAAEVRAVPSVATSSKPSPARAAPPPRRPPACPRPVPTGRPSRRSGAGARRRARPSRGRSGGLQRWPSPPGRAHLRAEHKDPRPGTAKTAALRPSR